VNTTCFWELTKGNTLLKVNDVNIYWKNSKSNLLIKHLSTEIDHHIENNQQVLSINTFEWSNSDKKVPIQVCQISFFKFEIPNFTKQQGFKHIEIKAPNIELGSHQPVIAEFATP
jgi:hypothetical protein